MQYTLQPKQAEAFFSPATEILYGGAAMGGKSFLMRMAALSWCTFIPGLQVYLFRRISDDLKKNHMEGPSSFNVLLDPYIRSKSVTITHAPVEISFNNGSKIFLCHCQYDKDRFRFLGSEIHVLMIDELTTFSKEIYTFLRSRVRMVGINLPPQYVGMFPRILCSSNPGNIGHNWVKETFVDIAPPMQIVQMPPEEGGLKRQFIPALMEDNQIGLSEDPTYEMRLAGMGSKSMVRAMRMGDWNIVAGGMFDDLWDRTIHVIPPFKIPPNWIVDRSYDDGDSKPFSVGWWAQADGTEVETAHRGTWAPPKGTLFRIHEWYGWNGRANEGCRLLPSAIAAGIIEQESVLRTSLVSGRILPGPADNSIFDAARGHAVADQMSYGRVSWNRSDKKAGSRVAGCKRMRTLLKASLEDAHDQPGIYVFDTCRHFIRTIPVLPRDENDSDDVDSDAEDHVWDETRYRILKQNTTPALMSAVGV